MKKSLLLAALGCSVLSASAQTAAQFAQKIKTPFGKLRPATWALLRGQLAHAASAAKNTGTAERLIGVADYDNGGITDSLSLYYSGTNTSLLNNLTGAGYDIVNTPFPTGPAVANNATASDRQPYVFADSAYAVDGQTFATYPRYYTYDGNMNLVSYRTQQGLDSFYYNAGGKMTQLVTLEGSQGAYSATNRLYFYYDNAGRPLHDSTFSAPDGSFVSAYTYTYDAAGNVTGYFGITDSSRYVYDAQNRVISEMTTFSDPNAAYSYWSVDSVFYNSTSTTLPYLLTDRSVLSFGGPADTTQAQLHLFANAAQSRIDSASEEEYDGSAWQPVETDTYLYNSNDHMTAHHSTDLSGGATSDTYFYYQQYTTGISAAHKLSASAFPNPATGMVTITAPANTTATLTGIDGRVLQQAANAKSIDLAPYAPGMYLLHLSNAAGSTTIKLMRK